MDLPEIMKQQNKLQRKSRKSKHAGVLIAIKNQIAHEFLQSGAQN